MGCEHPPLVSPLVVKVGRSVAAYRWEFSEA